MKETNKLQVKDLINIGIFTAIYFIIMFITGVLVKTVPILILLMPAFIGITCGTVYMLFITKVKKMGGIFMLAIIIGTLMSAISGMWLLFVTSLISGILAEIITAKGKYNSLTLTIAGYSIFNCWSIGAMLAIWLYKDWFYEKMSASGGAAYTELINAVTPLWVLFVIIIAAIIGGIIGGLIGKKILNKHFIKAGIA